LPRLLGDAEFTPEARRATPIMFVRTGANLIAIQLEEVIGSQEIVVKNTGPLLARVAGITGATVLGNGEIVLIINPIILGGREAGPVARKHVPGPPLTQPPEPVPPALPAVIIVAPSLPRPHIT